MNRSKKYSGKIKKKGKRSCFFVSILLVIFLLIAVVFVHAGEYPGGEEGSGTGESDWWPMLGHDLEHTRYSTSSAPETNTLNWTYQTNGDVESSPAVVDDRVYIGSSDNNVYCLDATNGDELWNYPTDESVWSSPAVVNGKVYVGSNDNNVYCLNAEDGIKIWNYSTDDDVRSSPAVYNGKVYIGSSDTNVYCLNAENGSRLWNYTTGYDVRSSPAVAGDRVFIAEASLNGNVYCLNAENGTKIWNYSTNHIVLASPVIYNNKIYICSIYQNVYCLNAENGSKIWEHQTSSFIQSSPAAYNNKIYLGSDSWNLYCLNAENGTEIWSYETDGQVQSSPALADGKIYFGSGDNKVYCLDAETKEEIWAYETNGRVCSSPAISKGKVYIGSNDNKVYCFGENQPPETPDQPDGPTEGEIGVEYPFSASTTDPNGDNICYNFSWGDGIYSGWLGPYNSGEIVEATHSYSNEGTFLVKVIAKDIYEELSSWSSSATIAITSSLPKLIIITPSSVIEDEVFQVIVTLGDIPIENVKVDFLGETYHTDVDGIVNLTAPQVDGDTNFLIVANKSGYQNGTAWIAVLDQRIDEPRGFIYGVVSYDSLPLEGVQIIITRGNENWITTTGKEGRYVQSVPPGQYTVEARKEGYKADIKTTTVTENVAIGVNLILEEDQVPSTGPVEKINYIDYTIQQKAFEGIIGARMDVGFKDKASVSYYSDELNIEFNSTDEVVSFTVSAEEGTNGTILVIYIGEGVLEDLDNLVVTYDGVVINESINVEEFFNINESSTSSWLRFLTTTGLYVFVEVPYFSEHTITISSIAEVVINITALILYIAICVIVLFVFFSPMLTNLLHIQKHSRKKK